MSLLKSARSLSPNEQTVLAATQLNSRTPIESISQMTGLHSHTIHRILRTLKDRGIIEPYLLINPHLLGLNDFCLFFNFSHHTSQSRSKIIAALKKSPHVAYAVELAGEYQYSASIFSSSVLAVDAVLKELFSLFPDTSITSAFALRVDWTLFSAPVQSPKSRHSIARTAVDSFKELDLLDRKFLYTYSRGPDKPITDIARQLGVSEGALRARLVKLIDSGVLVGIPYHVHWDRIGLLPMRAMLSLRGSAPLAIPQLYRKAKTDTAITEIVRCLGAWDIECNFYVPTPPAAGETIQQLHALFEGRVQQMRCTSEVAVHIMHRLPESLLTLRG